MPEGGGQFKFGTKEGDWTGHSAISEFNDVAEVGITAADGDNIVFGKGGWYTLEFIAKIKSNALVYTLNVYKAEVFVTGSAFGGFPDDGFNGVCTPPADNTGDWVSPAFTASGEMRAYVKVGDHVKAGDTVCIVEAMKMMNEITADYDCEILAVLVSNEQKVEYGEPLFRVKKL